MVRLDSRPLLCALVLLLGGCAARGPWLATGPVGERGAVELTAVPFFPQREYQCGPAALATALVASGAATTPEALVGQVYLPGRQGSLQAEVIAAARRHDRLPYPVDGTPAALDAALRDGRPVLVLLNLGRDWFPVWHYAVVVGLDPGADAVVLRSGVERRRTMPAGDFAAAWRRAEFWGLIVTPPDEVPAGARPEPWLAAAAGLEAVGRLVAAEAAYRAALRRWPGHPGARFGLGNVRALRGHPQEAVPHYRAYLDAEPGVAAAWNNLASAQLALGDLEGAHASLLRARALPVSEPVARALAITRAELAEAELKASSVPR